MKKGLRVREVRKTLDLNQTDFGERLGVKAAAISKVEKGENDLSDQMAKAICNTYGVSEIWLKDGIGEMFRKTDYSIGAMVDQLTMEGGDTADAVEVLMSIIKRMNKDQWKVMAELMVMLYEEMGNRKG